MSLHYVVLLLGSNLGDTELHLNNAIAKIENRLGKVIKTSEMIETEPIEFESINIFRNIALGLTTTFSPYFFLKVVKSIEKEMGREIRFSAIKIEDYQFARKKKEPFLMNIIEKDKIIMYGQLSDLL